MKTDQSKIWSNTFAKVTAIFFRDHQIIAISDSTSSKSDSSSLFSILKSSDEFMPSGESVHSSDAEKVRQIYVFEVALNQDLI